MAAMSKVIVFFPIIFFFSLNASCKTIYFKGRIIQNEGKDVTYFAKGARFPDETKMRINQYNVKAFPDGSNEGISIEPLYLKNFLFRIKDYKNQIEIVRLEIISPGFKKYIRNVSIESKVDSVVIDLGLIKLDNENLPKVEQVYFSTGERNTKYFKFIFYNPLNKNILITKTEISGYIPDKYPGQMCCCPPDATFEINENIQVVQKADKSKNVVASFKEKQTAGENNIAITGSITEDGCRLGQTLNLNLPSSFVLEPKKYLAIQIILPEKFNISSQNLKDDEFPELSVHDENKTLKRIKNTIVKFDFYEFMFSSNEGFSIVSSYKMR
jgi:hypothetical protein